MNLENLSQGNCMLQKAMDLCVCTMGRGTICARLTVGQIWEKENVNLLAVSLYHIPREFGGKIAVSLPLCQIKLYKAGKEGEKSRPLDHVKQTFLL